MYSEDFFIDTGVLKEISKKFEKNRILKIYSFFEFFKFTKCLNFFNLRDVWIF